MEADNHSAILCLITTFNTITCLAHKYALNYGSDHAEYIGKLTYMKQKETP